MIGEQFGNYRAVSLLGEGGMGAVYLAEHPGIGRRVAVKVLHKNFIRDESLLGRFLNEARAANAIRHPNIIEILDSGTIADGTPFLVMELLEGESLGTRIRRIGALPIPTAVEFAYQTASALGAAHKKGIVHRDLKPDNLFVVPDPHQPDRERIKVLDFGIAKLQQGNAADSVKTRTGTLMGTPIYMSPEQCRGTRTVDHRSDIYSLGIIFFEMLIGQPPFVSEGFGELVNMHLNLPPPAPSALRPEISPAIDAVVAKMLAKNPDDRYQDMQGLQVALKASGGSTFVVLGSIASSPDMNADLERGGRTPAPAPVEAPSSSRTPVSARVNTPSAARTPALPPVETPSNPKLRDTTFSTGVGERLGAQRGSRKGKGLLVMVGAAAAVVATGVVVFRDGEKLGVQHVEAGVGGSARPAPSPLPMTSPAVPATAPLPVAAALPRKITVRLESEPPGATVVDDAGGQVLGRTPLVLARPPGGALKLRMEKDGYLPNTHSVSLDEDSTIELTLEHKPRPHVHRTPRDAPADSEPAKL
jgi:eukaryotic-like serine/threonine-protein kinase